MGLSNSSLRRIAQSMSAQPLEELLYAVEGLPTELGIGIVEEIELLVGASAQVGAAPVDALRDLLDPNLVDEASAVNMLKRVFSLYGIQ